MKIAYCGNKEPSSVGKNDVKVYFATTTDASRLSRDYERLDGGSGGINPVERGAIGRTNSEHDGNVAAVMTDILDVLFNRYANSHPGTSLDKDNAVGRAIGIVAWHEVSAHMLDGPALDQNSTWGRFGVAARTYDVRSENLEPEYLFGPYYVGLP